MKVRFGVALALDTGPANFGAIIDRLEAEGIDSVWLSEQIYADTVDPFVGMAYALSRTTRLKVGTSVVVLPGRHPVLVAKQLSSLAALAPGRILPVFGVRSSRPPERELFPVAGPRPAVFDESLQLLRRLMSEESVDFEGQFFTLDSVRITPRPSKPIDLWLGGSAPAAFRRVGQLADGWLGSFLTPEEAGQGVATIQQAAAEAGRTVDADHFGITMIIAEDGIPDAVVETFRRRRPDQDPSDFIAGSWPKLHRLLDGYIAAGVTKFVLRPAGTRPYDEFLDHFVEELLPRQN